MMLGSSKRGSVEIIQDSYGILYIVRRTTYVFRAGRKTTDKNKNKLALNIILLILVCKKLFNRYDFE